MAGMGTFQDQYQSREWAFAARDFRRAHGNFCDSCRRSNIATQVHHVNYEQGKHIADYSHGKLRLYCDECHKSIHNSIQVFRDAISNCNASNISALVGLMAELIRSSGDNGAAIKLAQIIK